MNHFNPVAIKTSAPSYLKEFMLEESEIILVYDKRGSTAKEDLCIISDGPKSKEKEDNLDLTGSPLNIDLGGNESFTPVATGVSTYNWTPEEAKYYPLSLSAARKYINQQMKSEEEQSFPFYAVCDTTDSLRTVIIGAQKKRKTIMSSAIYILPCNFMDSDTLSLNIMVDDHRRNVGIVNAEIDYLVKIKYFIYGIQLQRHKALLNTDIQGSISVAVTCLKCVFNVLRSISDLKMNLQVILGHRCSSLQSFWEELHVLHNYADILLYADKSNGETELCHEPLDECDVLNSIRHLMTTNIIKKKTEKELDLKNLREDTFLDKLWKILRRCGTLGELRDSFHFVFEELAESTTNVIIRDEDKSNIGSIVSGIINGKLIISTITFPQAMELLLELGLEKLKNDYQTILKHFCCSVEQVVSSKWSELQEKDVATQAVYRKTRITQNLKSCVRLEEIERKMKYLCQLHIATEFIYLVKEQVNLSEESFDSFCQCVSDHYAMNDLNYADFSDLLNNPLCEYSFKLNSADIPIIDGSVPVKWSMQMKSNVKPNQNSPYKMEITTVYNLSKNIIFPSAVATYNETENSTDHEEKFTYYISKMVTHKEYF